MRIAHGFPLLLLCMVTGCASTAPFNHPNASGHYASEPEQCAVYARKMSGIRLYGAADSWWQAASPRYRRGQKPAAGAVLVLKATSHMRYGHVAVVRNILGPRRINVTHTDWGGTRHTRRIIYDSQRVEDVSAANDWSRVRFWNDEKGVLGFPYEAYGFIYAQAVGETRSSAISHTPARQSFPQ